MENLKIINKSSLINNLMFFRSKKICAMVKANGYGHGLKEIVSILQDKVEYFGVVNLDEALQIRKICNTPILLCSKVFDFEMCRRNNIEVMIENERDLKSCVEFGLKDSCHLKVNSGMNRFGVKGEFNLRFLNKYLEENKIKLKSIYTHFSSSENYRQTIKEYTNFMKMRSEIVQNPPVCFGGSGMICYPFKFDMIRVGIGLYGYGNEKLLPVMRVESFVLKVFYAYAGEYIGYGKEYKVKKSGFFAVVSLGYGDGLNRNLSEKLEVIINERKYKLVGKICMDAFFIEADESVKILDRVIVMFNAEEMAKKCNSISYEILTNFSNLRGKTKII